MKKIIIFLVAAVLTVFLALFFFLRPSRVIAEINRAQQAVVMTAGSSGGNLLSGYQFRRVSFMRRDGTRLLDLDEVTLNAHLLPLMFGKIGIEIHSREIAAVFSLNLGGSLTGEARFKGILFDTASVIPPTNISFTAPVSGRVIVSGRKAEIEVKADEISWKKLSVAGFDLPLNIFEKGKGALSVEQGRIVITSLAFEGSKGYARLSGEIHSGQRQLVLELFPSDWNDFLLIPLERYKVSPGQYNMTLNL